MTNALIKERLAHFDLTKGLLVVIMVVYHSLNYSSQYYLAFRYFSFLPPSFIFITGLLVSAIYPLRYDRHDGRVYARLVVRGAKLVALFTFLNICVRFVVARGGLHGGQNVKDYFWHLYEVYLLGDGAYAIFEVLLPIGYLLLASAVLLRLVWQNSLALGIIAFGTFAVCVVLPRLGVSAGNLNLLSFGVFGMWFGLSGVLVRRLLFSRAFLATMFVSYAAYYPLSLARGYVYEVQLVGAILAVMGIVAASTHIPDTSWTQRRLIKLGQYSLLAYIAQIAILQVGLRLVGRPEPLSPLFFGVFGAALLLMAGLIEGVDWMRKSHRIVDRAYRAVFS